MFEDSRLKIGRADKHIAEFDFTIASFLSPDFYSIREYRDPKTAKKYIEYGFAKPIPIEPLALVIGDAIHNLKCALDYSWRHTVAKLAANTHRFSKFPVYPSLLELQKALRGAKIHLLNPSLCDFVASKIKPYDGGNPVLWTYSQTGHP